MLDFFNTVAEEDVYTLRYNNTWRILNNSGNTLGYDAYHKLDHLNSSSELVGTNCIFLF